MKFLLKVFLLNRPKEQGFVLPVIIALGLIMTLVGTISIFQSSDEQLTATSQRASAKALAAAEIGVARYRELIDKFKVIATYPACESWDYKGDTDPTNDECGDDPSSTSILSWFKAANIPNIAVSCFTNPAATVAGKATKDWQYVDSDGNGNYDSGEIQYRLINYTYTSNYNTGTGTYNSQPIGTLVVEGRVNQDNLERENDSQASVAQIEVELPIQPGIPTPNGENIELEDNFNNLNPTLWITGDPDNATVDASLTNVSGLKVQGNIIVTDTDCSVSNTIPTDANLVDSNNQFVLISPTRPGDDSSSTAIYKYPRVDVDGDGTDEVDTTWDEDVNNDTTNDINLLSGIDAPITLPRASDLSETRPDGSIYYHYVVDGNINLDNEDIVIQAGRKVILYVKGNITLTAGSGNSVNINARNNNNKSYNLEIYGTSLTNKIIFQGDGEIKIKALIYAPKAQVEVLNDPTVVIDGAVWVKDWKGTSLTNDVTIQPDDPGNPTLISEQYFNYTYVKNDLVNLEVRLVDPIISVPSRWETQEAE